MLDSPRKSTNVECTRMFNVFFNGFERKCYQSTVFTTWYLSTSYSDDVQPLLLDQLLNQFCSHSEILHQYNTSEWPYHYQVTEITRFSKKFNFLLCQPSCLSSLEVAIFILGCRFQFKVFIKFLFLIFVF